MSHDQRGHVVRGRGRAGRMQRKSRWPKNSEIPKGDPLRWAIKWGSDQNDDRACSVDSGRVDPGYGDNQREPVVPAGIDLETGFILTDFDGNLAPPPIDWDARPAFRPPQSVGVIEKWQKQIEEEMLGKTWLVVKADLLMPGDLAPRCWAPVVVGRESPTKFWNRVVTSDEPPPIDGDDLVSVRPWWETYGAENSCVLRPYNHPEVAGPSPKETQQERIQRENDRGSLHHAENRKRAELAKCDAERERRKKAMEKASKLSAGQAGLPREIKPGINLYIRSANSEDIPHITRIYNHYVEHTVCVPETDRRKDADILQRYDDILNKKLPFIVACERSGVLKPRKRTHEAITLPEKLLGFAYADDHHDLKGMFQFTCDVEVYTDSAIYMKGIGKCLMDKLLGLLDADYIQRSGYAVEGVDLEGTSPLRVISNIIASVLFEKEERLEWKRRFLTEFAGFEQVGLMNGIGNKLGQSVSVAIFQRKTGTQFDPRNPPIMSEYMH